MFTVTGLSLTAAACAARDTHHSTRGSGRCASSTVQTSLAKVTALSAAVTALAGVAAV
jgi:hypothetical protein